MAPVPTLQDGTPLPSLIYGTTIHTSADPQPNVRQALLCGYRGIDTAPTRKFHNEFDDGDAIQDIIGEEFERTTSRRSLLVQTKYTSPHGHHGDTATWPYNIIDSHSLRVFKSILRSAENLKVDVIDVYFLHSVLTPLPNTLELWQAMEEAAYQGAVRYLGLCNVCKYSLEYIWNAVTVKPLFVQNPFPSRQLGDQEGYDVKLIRFCRQQGIVYEIYGIFRPMNSGLLACNPVKMLASCDGITAHQALLRLILEAANLVELRLCILDGATNSKHMEDNITAASGNRMITDGVSREFLQLLGWDKLEIDST